MKTALVISGGGSRGAFAVGVLKYIVEQRPELQFDLYCGTSTGSLIIPLAALGETALLETMYTTKNTEDIILTGNLVKRFVQNNSLFDSKPLANLILETYTQQRFDQLMQSDKALFFTTVSLQTGRITYFSTHDPLLNHPDYDVVKITSRDVFARAVLASANQPVFMQPIDIPANSGQQFVDGGVREVAPIQLAIENGATDIYTIVLSPAQSEPETKKYESVLDILLRTIDLFTEDIGINDVRLPQLYNRALTYIQGVKERVQQATGMSQQQIDALFASNDNLFQGKVPVRMHIIRPQKPLEGGPGGLDFVPEKMKLMLAQGMEAARNFFENPPPFNQPIV